MRLRTTLMAAADLLVRCQPQLHAGCHNPGRSHVGLKSCARYRARSLLMLPVADCPTRGILGRTDTLGLAHRHGRLAPIRIAWRDGGWPLARGVDGVTTTVVWVHSCWPLARRVDGVAAAIIWRHGFWPLPRCVEGVTAAIVRRDSCRRLPRGVDHVTLRKDVICRYKCQRSDHNQD
jgi:hypothetical protein